MSEKCSFNIGYIKKKILFLDFDGVMDTAYYDHIFSRDNRQSYDSFGILFDPDCIKALRYIIDRTGADIVVSSSWKYNMTMRDLWDMWECRRLPGKVIDVTPSPQNRRKRGDEIDAWLNECLDDCVYAIVDDLDGQNFNDHQIENLFVVNPFNGLDKLTAERIVNHLNCSY